MREDTYLKERGHLAGLTDEQLDDLHALKRRLARERGERLTLDDLLREGVDMLLRYHGRQESTDTKEGRAT